LGAQFKIFGFLYIWNDFFKKYILSLTQCYKINLYDEICIHLYTISTQYI